MDIPRPCVSICTSLSFGSVKRMKHTVSLKLNHEFRRLYNKGMSAAGPYMAIYCRKNRRGHNRLGVTVSAKDSLGE